VVEAFFLGDGDRYLEVQFGPHGHYLMALFQGNDNIVNHGLKVEYKADIGNTFIICVLMIGSG
jgi:hypothetical protein